MATAKFKSLPRSTCKLKSLKYLDPSGNKKLQKLPHNLGSLEDLTGTSIEELLFSVRCLSKLVIFDISACSKLKYIPSSIDQYLSRDLSDEVRTFSLIGCYNLDWQLPKEIMEDALLKYYYISAQFEDLSQNRKHSLNTMFIISF